VLASSGDDTTSTGLGCSSREAAGCLFSETSLNYEFFFLFKNYFNKKKEANYQLTTLTPLLHQTACVYGEKVDRMCLPSVDRRSLASLSCLCSVGDTRGNEIDCLANSILERKKKKRY